MLYLTTEKEHCLTEDQINAICEKYRKADEKGKVHCSECPLAFDTEMFLCIKNAAYIPATQEWVPEIDAANGKKLLDLLSKMNAISRNQVEKYASIDGKQDFWYWDGVNDAIQEVIKVVSYMAKE